MNVFESPGNAVFAVVGITAALVVPTGPASAEAGPTYILVGSNAFTTLESALAVAMLQFAPDTSRSSQGEASHDDQAALEPAPRSIPTRPDFGARARRVHSALTEREREVLCLLAGGATNRTIASRLFISPKTASVHVSRILTKLNAITRTEAAALAHASGLVQPWGTVSPQAVERLTSEVSRTEPSSLRPPAAAEHALPRP